VDALAKEHRRYFDYVVYLAHIIICRRVWRQLAFLSRRQLERPGGMLAGLLFRASDN
jgi:hypothetical protein